MLKQQKNSSNMLDNRKSDYQAKILVIGDSGVGKTCLILRYCDDVFTYSHLSTIGVDYKMKSLEYKDKTAKLQIWDTAGQERFRTITTSFYKGASGIILAYACDNRSSFNNVESWMAKIQESASDKVCKLLVGTKSDSSERVVTLQEGQKLAESNQMKFFETSAKDNINVTEAFETIAQDVFNVLKSRLRDDDDGSEGVVTLLNKEKNRKGNCVSNVCG